MAQNISLYKNLQDIDSVTFHEIKFTGNIYLVDKNYVEGKKYDEKEVKIITENWLNLYDEYFKRTDDVRFRQDLKNKDETLRLLLKINLIDSVVELLENLEENKEYIPNEVYLKTVASLGNNLKRVEKYIKFDITKPIKDQIDKINAVKGGLQTRYELLFKEDLKVEKSDVMLYYDIKAHIEQALDRNLPEIINMLQWIAYEKLYKKKLSNGRK